MYIEAAAYNKGTGDFEPPDAPEECWEAEAGSLNVTALLNFTAAMIERTESLTALTARQRAIDVFTSTDLRKRRRSRNIDEGAQDMLARLRELASFLREFESQEEARFDVTPAGLEALLLNQAGAGREQ